MVGLFGTVISMIGTFNEIAKSGGGGGVGGQAQGIGLALFATAFGLITAIPLVFAHVLMKAWVNKFETRMKSAALKLNLLLQAKPAKGAKGADGAATGVKTADQTAAKRCGSCAWRSRRCGSSSRCAPSGCRTSDAR